MATFSEIPRRTIARTPLQRLSGKIAPVQRQSRGFQVSPQYGAGRTGVVGWLRNRTRRLKFWARRGQQELFPHELQSPQAQATQPDLILQFREQGFHLRSLPLCMGELWRVGQLPGTLPSRFIHVHGKRTKRCATSELANIAVRVR
ncbi:MAG: hypothetical protein WA628_06115 [Terriglobales bacterium]